MEWMLTELIVLQCLSGRQFKLENVSLRGVHVDGVDPLRPAGDSVVKLVCRSTAERKGGRHASSDQWGETCFGGMVRTALSPAEVMTSIESSLFRWSAFISSAGSSQVKP